MHPSIFATPDRYGMSEADAESDLRELAAEGYEASTAIVAALDAAGAHPTTDLVRVRVSCEGSGNFHYVHPSILGEVVKALANDPTVTFIQIGTDDR